MIGHKNERSILGQIFKPLDFNIQIVIENNSGQSSQNRKTEGVFLILNLAQQSRFSIAKPALGGTSVN